MDSMETQLGDYLNARSKIGKFSDYAAKNIAFAPAIPSVVGKIHLEFLCLLWVLADMQTVKYFNFVGDEKDIGNERFKWSRASTFGYNKMRLALPLHTLQPGVCIKTTTGVYIETTNRGVHCHYQQVCALTLSAEVRIVHTP